MDLSLIQPEPAMNGPFMGRPLMEAVMPIKRPDMNNGFDLTAQRPGSEFLQPNIGVGGGGIGQYLQPMIRQINSHYQQNEVQPFVQEITQLANQRFPNAFQGGGLGIGNFLQQQRPLPTQDIFSGVSGAALGLLAAR